MTIDDNYRGPLSFKWFIDNEQKIDLSPENYQRCFVWDAKKQTELLRTIFDSNPGLVPEIHIRNYTKYINTTKRNGIIAELMDGQQRMTTMIRFYTNKIKTPKNLEFELDDGSFIDISEKFINELPKAAFDFFVEYKLQVAFYTDITDSDAADIFKNKLNSGKPLTEIEKRNAHNTEVARFVRNTARLGNGKIPRHDLFDTTLDEDGLIIFKNFDPKHIKYQTYAADEIISIICHMAWKGNKSVSANIELDRMYSCKDFTEKFQYEKRVKNCLDVLKSIITSSAGISYKRIWNLTHIKFVMRLWMELDSVHNLKIDGYDKFVKSYLINWNTLSIPSLEEKKLGKKASYFKECVVRPKSPDAINYSLTTMIPVVIKNQTDWGLIEKNKEVREFPIQLKLAKHAEQDGICPMCHEKIETTDIHGGHIVSYRDGGETTSENLVVLHARCNMKLGAAKFNPEDYVKS